MGSNALVQISGAAEMFTVLVALLGGTDETIGGVRWEKRLERQFKSNDEGK